MVMFGGEPSSLYWALQLEFNDGLNAGFMSFVFSRKATTGAWEIVKEVTLHSGLLNRSSFFYDSFQHDVFAYRATLVATEADVALFGLLLLENRPEPFEIEFRVSTTLENAGRHQLMPLFPHVQYFSTIVDSSDSDSLELVILVDGAVANVVTPVPHQKVEFALPLSQYSSSSVCILSRNLHAAPLYLNQTLTLTIGIPGVLASKGPVFSIPTLRLAPADGFNLSLASGQRQILWSMAGQVHAQLAQDHEYLVDQLPDKSAKFQQYAFVSLDENLDSQLTFMNPSAESLIETAGMIAATSVATTKGFGAVFQIPPIHLGAGKKVGFALLPQMISLLYEFQSSESKIKVSILKDIEGEAHVAYFYVTQTKTTSINVDLRLEDRQECNLLLIENLNAIAADLDIKVTYSFNRGIRPGPGPGQPSWFTGELIAGVVFLSLFVLGCLIMIFVGLVFLILYLCTINRARYQGLK